MTLGTELDRASAQGRLKAHTAYLRNLGRSLLNYSHQAAAEEIDAAGRAAADAAARRFMYELDQRVEVTVAQSADIPQTVDRKAFSALIHSITCEYVRAVARESNRILFSKGAP